MKKGCAALAVIAALSFVGAAPVFAEEKKQDRPGGVQVKAVSVTATVDLIDYKTRQVSLRGPQGGVTTFIAGDEVKNLDKVKKGDLVTFDYTEGIAVDVQKASEAPRMIQSQSIKRSTVGDRPTGSIETVGFLTARVDKINYKTRKVSLSLPEGQNIEITAGDQVKRLDEVKKGDEVVVQYAQKLTIRVAKPK